MATAFDIITSAMRLVGVLADGEQPDATNANTGLDVFNDMLDAWNAERTAIYTTRSDDYPFTLNQQTYTLGPGGDFDAPRPARIEAMSAILLTPNAAQPIEVPMNLYSVEDWQTMVPVKQVQGSFPQICYDDGDFPFRGLNFWPIPNTTPCSVRIYSWQALPAQSLASTVTFPPGYAEAFRYNLAARIGPEFGVTPSSLVITLAVQGLARIKTMNAPDLGLRSDLLPNAETYNWSADMFGNPYS